MLWFGHCSEASVVVNVAAVHFLFPFPRQSAEGLQLGSLCALFWAAILKAIADFFGG